MTGSGSNLITVWMLKKSVGTPGCVRQRFFRRCRMSYRMGNRSPFTGEPLVAGDFGLRFYASVPLRTQAALISGPSALSIRNPPGDQNQIDDLKI